VVDQDAQPDIAAAMRAAGVDANVTAQAMRELAKAIGDLAGAIRESAAFAGEFELLPCAEVGGTGPDEQSRDAAGEDSRAGWLPLVPAQRDGTSADATEGSSRRPGGCACAQPEAGQGRHARRDDTQDSPAGVEAVAR
jgi:hypothetical protein